MTLILDLPQHSFLFVIVINGSGRGTNVMKSFIIACVAAIVIAVIGMYVLDSVQKPVNQAFTTQYVRV